MRTLWIDNIKIPLPDAEAEALIKRDILYECGNEPGNHDLHINPEQQFDLKIVEMICLAQAKWWEVEKDCG